LYNRKSSTIVIRAISKLTGRSFKGNRIDVHLVNNEEWADVSDLLGMGAGAKGEDTGLTGI